MGKKGKVYFIGAGPGDPELLTIKGKKIIEQADVIIYAGSLVNPAVLAERKEGAKIYNSASMNLEEILDVMLTAALEGKCVARVQTGDTCLYGALNEQVMPLEQHNIEVEIIPGVMSASAAAAALKIGFTRPDGAQTVIFARQQGRTPVPDQERLASLSGHCSTLCLFLSVHMIDRVIEEIRAGYADDTPVAVVYKASWEDQKIIRGTINDIADRVKNAGISRQAIIIVGDVLRSRELTSHLTSKLYDKEFVHGFRG